MNHKIIKNISLLMNSLFIALLLLSIGWMGKLKSIHNQIMNEKDICENLNHSYEEFIVNNMYASTFLGMEFPKVKMMDIHGRKISSDFSTVKGGFVLFFSPQSCQPCLITQLKILQYYYDALEDPLEFPVYAIANSSSVNIKKITRAFDLKYSLISNIEEGLFDSTFFQNTPIVFLVNSKNLITNCHIPSPGRREFSLLFYNEMRARQIRDHLGVNIDLRKSSLTIS